MTNDIQPLLQVDLEENGGTVTFRTLEEIQEWTQKEIAFWSWLKPVGKNSLLVQAANQLRAPHKAIQRVISQAQNQSETVIATKISEIQPVFLNHFAKNKSLVSSTPRAQFVNRLKNDDDDLAAHVLRFFLGLGIEPGDHLSLRAALIAVMFDEGIRPQTSKAEKDALRGLRDKWQSHLTEYQQTQDELLTAIRVTDGEIKQVRSQQAEVFQERLDEAGTALEELVSESTERLGAIQKTYDRQLGLEAPVSYWRGKRKIHERNARHLGWISIVSGISVAIGLSLVAWFLLGGATPPIGNFAVFLVLSSLSIWGLRVLVRQYLSHVHLATDAAERQVMTNTYLSLLKSRGANDEDAHLLLQMLFRPATTGIMRDDGLPASALDVVERLTRGK